MPISNVALPNDRREKFNIKNDLKSIEGEMQFRLPKFNLIYLIYLLKCNSNYYI